MENLSIPLIEVAMISGAALGVALVFLFVGYCMGRSSKGEPVQISGVPLKGFGQKIPPPYHDDGPDAFEEALTGAGKPDDKKRIPTI